MIYSYESIRAVHLEITDRCNSGCPMCPRYVNGEEAPHIQNTQFSLDDAKTMFPPEFITQINRVNFCGNNGDPLLARDLLPIIKYFRSINDTIRVEVNTNASVRREEWWTELAQVMGSDEATSGVWFALDGLSDTNHLYRLNTNWEVIMRNAKAFIAAGGIAHWNFIAFEHNEHQIVEAKTLAHEMGFKHFNLKLTARFYEGRACIRPKTTSRRRPRPASRHQPQPTTP
jgi:MoaA/NifB/PqqE/SkfB family radical SAM enzyme